MYSDTVDDTAFSAVVFLFSFIYTTYENIGYCKPSPEYYKEILRRMNISPEDCMMVGNDTDEDMIAETLGMKVFLISGHVVNRKGMDINAWPHGGFEAFIDEWNRQEYGSEK